MNQTKLPQLSRILVVLCVILLIAIFSETIFTLRTIRHLGVLVVTSTDKTATLSITGDSTEAKIIGNGSTKVRLKPGSYQLLAVDANVSARKTIVIEKNKTLAVNLTLTTKPLLPSRDNYTYTGTDEFISQGLTATQVAGIQQAIFQYIQQQKLSVSNIDFSNITITPFDPHQTSGVTTGTFTVTLDNSTTFNASLSYSDLTHIDVVLHNSTTGAVVYDSGSILPN